MSSCRETLGSDLISDVFRNNRGMFTAISTRLPGVRDSSVAWGDYDNDGNRDILLTGTTDVGPISRVYRNDRLTFIDIGAGLPGVAGVAAAAWGDYDNDGDLDILLTGRTDVDASSRVYRNDGATANQAPDAPTDLAAATRSTQATLSWTAPSDNPPTSGGAPTRSSGLSYNLRVGTTPGAADVVAPMSFSGTTAPPDGLRKVAIRGLIQGTSWTLKGLTPGVTYYWSVQAVDTALAGSGFAAEGSFTAVKFSDISADLPGVSSSQFGGDSNDSVAWGDYDNDGDLDILLTGWTGSEGISRVYRNDGETFTDIEAGLPGVSRQLRGLG